MSFSGNIVKKRQALVGQRLTLCRKKAGLSKSALARLAGVSRSTLLRAERGEDVRVGTLMCLADVLGVRVRDLMPLIDDSRSRVE